DIVQFAKAVGVSYPGIDKKVCDGGHARGRKSGDNGTVADYTDGGASQANKTAQCSGMGTSKAGRRELGLTEFVNKTKVGEGKNWPTGYVNDGSNNVNVLGDTNGNAKAVAKDLTKLTPEEKTIVAGLLAKTIEGGEVVEIRAVSSTSVMVNACYDLLSEGLGVVPYACVGLGGNFVGVVDGHITIRPSLTLYAPSK
ncbi:P44/Msp2 family outer membrane protein, partial [Anaplasma phagocytophilum]|uniref:P44/Msp2 family outer membrane protein n=1 Tax=Anaplasma phagocytophilum TaxID=948 RepID=UPI00123D82BC